MLRDIFEFVYKLLVIAFVGFVIYKICQIVDFAQVWGSIKEVWGSIKDALQFIIDMLQDGIQIFAAIFQGALDYLASRKA